MQRVIIPVLTLLAIGAGVFAYLQHAEVAGLRSQLAALTAERDAALDAAKRATTAADTAGENVARLTQERDTAVERVKGVASSSPLPMPTDRPGTGGESGGKTMMQGIAKMFESEDGKKMMRAQMAMGIKMQYGGIAKDLKLDPAVADQVLALLADRQAAISEVAFATMTEGAIDEKGAKSIAEKSEAVQKEYDAKLRAVLGDEGMTQLTAYERTSGDRMMLSMHESQFAAAGAPLEPAQRDGLLEIMKQERLKTPVSALDANSSNGPAKAISAINDDAAVEKWLTQEQDYQRRVLQSATRALNPDQVNALQQSFKQQLEMQRFGVKMGREMFKGGTGPANMTVPPGAPPGPPAR